MFFALSHRPFWTIVLVVSISACSYRFTNTNIIRPEGIESIAVEAVYDTSREVISHEIIWDELQAALAADGHLRLAPRQNADAILRTHLKTATIAATGSRIDNDKTDQDPKFFDGQLPAAPDKFRRLTQAGEIRDSGTLAIVIEVEVVSLRTKEMLLKRNYSFSRSFRTLHGQPGNTTITTVGNDFLRYEEAIDAKTRHMAQELSRRVLKDLFVR